VNDGDHQGRRSDGVAVPEAIRGNLGTVLCNITVGVAVSRRGALVWANPVLAQLCAVGEPDELLGKPIDALWRDAGGGLPGPAGPQPTEVELRRSDGEWARARVRCLAVPEDAPLADRPAGAVDAVDAGGKLEAEVWLVEDVTRLARRESELLHANRELREARRELEALRERLAVEAEEREQLLGVVSHELRTPVTVISGYSRLLLAGEVGQVNDEQRRFLTECHKSCNRLDEFIGRLLDASQAIRGEDPLDLDCAPLDPTVRGVVGFLRPLIDERELHVEVDLDPDTPWARFDASRIEQVITNLMGNAIKYAGRGGRVRVTTRPLWAAGRAFAEVAVADDGPGVPLDLRERIFEPYVRGPGGRNTGGLGLGLAICKRLVEAHGGAITIGDADGGGARFAFSLPAAPQSADAAPGEG
jgi:signal transduction histidine kinase